MTLARTVWLILKKDLVIELRTREVLATMVLFSILLVVVFAFAFSVDETRARLVGPGILWVVILFSGTLGLTRLFDRERDNGCLDALLLAPGGPKAVYIAKVAGLFLFVLAAELLTTPLIFAFIGLGPPPGGLGLLVGAMVLGTLGFALVGTLFGAMLANARLREVLVPVVVYPVVVPVIIAGVKLTSIAMGGGLPEEAGGWLELMIGFDLLYLIVPPWVFGRVMMD